MLVAKAAKAREKAHFERPSPPEAGQRPTLLQEFILLPASKAVQIDVEPAVASAAMMEVHSFILFVQANTLVTFVVSTGAVGSAMR